MWNCAIYNEIYINEKFMFSCLIVNKHWGEVCINIQATAIMLKGGMQEVNKWSLIINTSFDYDRRFFSS